ncbi:MAG: hypothetical protein AAFZ65_11210 [Planctomycetota bacterium]
MGNVPEDADPWYPSLDPERAPKHVLRSGLEKFFIWPEQRCSQLGPSQYLLRGPDITNGYAGAFCRLIVTRDAEGWSLQLAELVEISDVPVGSRGEPARLDYLEFTEGPKGVRVRIRFDARYERPRLIDGVWAFEWTFDPKAAESADPAITEVDSQASPALQIAAPLPAVYEALRAQREAYAESSGR